VFYINRLDDNLTTDKLYCPVCKTFVYSFADEHLKDMA
jgi:hypothetical protein